MILFCGNYWQNLQVAPVVHYFHYESHNHYHCHHFRCHCKIHLYCLRTLLTIPLDRNMIPCLFLLNFVCFSRTYIFLQSYSKLYVFYAQWKDSEFAYDPQIFLMFSLFILISISIQTFLFTLILIYTYLH